MKPSKGMMATRHFFWWLVLTALAAPAPAQNDPLKNINWGTFKEGQHSQIKEPWIRVINNEAEFQTYWAKAMGASPASAPQGVNWLKDQLIAIHLGERRSGGYSVRVESIRRTRAAEITVDYVEFTPSRGAITTQALTSPWVLTRMERKAGNLNFTKSTRETRPSIVVRGCGCCGSCRWSAGPLEEILPAYRELPIYTAPYDRRVAWRTIRQGSLSGIVTGGVTAIRSPDELLRYWSAHADGSRLPVDPERFDWERDQLVAIHVGKLPGTGYEVALDSLERTGQNTITVRYTVIYPAAPAYVGSPASSPYVLIRMDRTYDRFIPIRRNYLPSIDGAWGCSCGCASCRARR